MMMFWSKNLIVNIKTSFYSYYCDALYKLRKKFPKLQTCMEKKDYLKQIKYWKQSFFTRAFQEYKHRDNKKFSQSINIFFKNWSMMKFHNSYFARLNSCGWWLIPQVLIIINFLYGVFLKCIQRRERNFFLFAMPLFEENKQFDRKI